MKTYIINKGVKSYISFMVTFSVIAMITIVSRVFAIDNIQNLFKPLLMPILMLFVFVNSRLATSFSRFLFFALLFSLAGDVFLMPYFDNFLLGLASFLFAHVFYIAAFLKNNSLVAGLKKNKIFSVVIFVAYLILLFVLISNMLNSNVDSAMIGAVVVYASVITVMVLSTISLHGNNLTLDTRLMMIGALLFMFSDSVIAINKFVIEIPYSGFWIMSTYTLAQWLIVVGGLTKLKSK